jgi:hypothetical protein
LAVRDGCAEISAVTRALRHDLGDCRLAGSGADYGDLVSVSESGECRLRGRTEWPKSTWTLRYSRS